MKTLVLVLALLCSPSIMAETPKGMNEEQARAFLELGGYDAQFIETYMATSSKDLEAAQRTAITSPDPVASDRAKDLFMYLYGINEEGNYFLNKVIAAINAK